MKESAKLSFILAIECIVDPLITELQQSLLAPNCQDVSEVAIDALSATKASVSNIKSATLRTLPVKIYVPVMSTTGSLSLNY